MSKGDIAKQNFMNGYNCSQAVLLAFCEDFGLEKETALKISEPFGGGIMTILKTIPQRKMFINRFRSLPQSLKKTTALLFAENF